VGEHVEQVTVLCINNPLHLGELVVAEAFLGQALQQFLACVRGAPDGAQFCLVLEEVGQP
jgi:hypothetical protein